MSVGHNHRRKAIRRFKKQYGKDWHKHFQAHCDELSKGREQTSPAMGNPTGAGYSVPPAPVSP